MPEYQIITYKESKTILKPVASNSTEVIPLFNKALPANLQGTVIAVNSLITNLKVYAKITSLGAIAMPNFSLEDSETDKLYKALDIEWKSPRKQLDFLLSIDDINWQIIGSISLLNPSGYPYRIYNILNAITDDIAIELGDNGMIGMQVKDVGYGGINGNDQLTVYGSYIREIVIQQEIVIPTPTPVPTPTPNEEDELMALAPLTYSKITAYTTTSDGENLVIDENLNRKYLLIKNERDFAAYIRLSGLGLEIKILPYDYFELSRFGLWFTGGVYCNHACDFTLIEGV